MQKHTTYNYITCRSCKTPDLGQCCICGTPVCARCGGDEAESVCDLCLSSSSLAPDTRWVELSAYA